MSTEAIGAAAPDAVEATIVISGRPAPEPEPDHLHDDQNSEHAGAKPTGLHSPPDSNNAMKLDGSDSELSDLDDIIPEDMKDDPSPPKKDIGEVLPDHWSGAVPVFKPTMEQFEDFKLFMEKIDSYGMKSGIVKVIPPQEWKDSLPALDELVKTIRVREPIKQDIMGSNGMYRQVNILHQRSYNLPQWRQLCDQSEHQPPARRGERRANQEKPKSAPRPRAAASSSAASNTTPTKKRRGRPVRSRGKQQPNKDDGAGAEDRPITPVSPAPEEEKVVESVERDPGVKEDDDDACDDTPVIRRMGFSRQAKPKTQSTSARRKYVKREASVKIDEAAFKDWDYRMDVSDYTPERCEELERVYWKTLTYAPPLYGADLLGTLFDERTTMWNLNKLPNLLDVLGTRVPGVNTAYLYLGMWKATFAWHLEDVDLYSINYLHFGAPKQWYSISQKDARRFEAAMKNIWPTEAKACDQFLRHKAFLISPMHLQQHYNIKVNKCVSYPGEFVVTYPYGYHSGYNLGYNCAEAVNFALDTWLPMGKIARKCECAQAQDSVWVDVYEIERRLRGESTEYETDDEDEEDEDQELDGSMIGLPTPPSSHTVRTKGPGRKRKRPSGDKDGKPKVKKIRLRIKTQAEPPCCLCPNSIPGAEILETDDGRKAHRLCALYLPETYIETVGEKEVVTNAANINKARLDLKCLYCRSKRGACFQCSQRKCARAYHATCAAAAGVFVEEADVPIFGEDGTEYKEQAFEFSCRFHRTKRDKRLDGEALEENTRVLEAASALKKNDICQIQYYRGDIFAGVVVENRHSERTVLLDVIPNGDRVEVEWKWLLLPDPADFHLPKASANALPMPTSRKAKDEINAKKRPTEELPRAHSPFVEGFTWAEFHTGDTKNPEQAKVELAKENQVWHYLGKTSTESKAQYTEDPAKPQHNVKSNFLDSIPKPKPKPAQPSAPAQPRRAHPAAHPAQPERQPVTAQAAGTTAPRAEKPYVYKPRKPIEPDFDMHFPVQKFVPRTPVSRTPVPVPRIPGAAPAQPQPPPGSDPRFRVQTSFYSSDRFAPVAGSNGFPQLPGVSPSPAQLAPRYSSPPQPKVWPASGSPIGPRPYRSGSSSSTGSLLARRPTVSQQSTPQRVLEGQHTRAYQKYSFFQVHHNRDSTRYRTPYAAWGGFTNGYEGNLRAHLMRAQEGSTGSKSILSSIPESLRHPLRSYSGSPQAASVSSHPSHNSYNRQPESATPSLAPSPMPHGLSKPNYRLAALSPLPSQPQYPPTGSVPQVSAEEQSSAPLHPAIRPQYGASWQQNYSGTTGQAAAETAPTAPQAGGEQARNATIPNSDLLSAVSFTSLSRSTTAGFETHVPQNTIAFGAQPGSVVGGKAPSLTSQAQQHPAAQLESHPWNQSANNVGLTRAYPWQHPVAKAATPPASSAPFPQLVPNAMQLPEPQDPLSRQTPVVPFGSQEALVPTSDSVLSALAPNVREYADVPPDSTALVEQMMLNLRRASEKGDVGA